MCGKKVKMRDVMLRRVDSECPISCIHHADHIASTIARWDMPHWQEYTAYSKKYECCFSIDHKCGGGVIRNNDVPDLLCGLRFSMTLITEVFLRVLPLSDRNMSIILEAHHFIFQEPVERTATYKSINAPFVNVSCCHSVKGFGCKWRNVVYSGRDYKGASFSPLNIELLPLEDRYTNVDHDSQAEGSSLATYHVLSHLHPFLRQSMTMPFTPRSCITMTVFRAANSITGYVGSDFANAIITQVDKYKHHPPPTDESLQSIRETFTSITQRCLTEEPRGRPTSRGN